MMTDSQNGIVYYKNSKNIGDDIQTYAAWQLVENAVFCDREQLHHYQTPKKLLCNGWFMKNGANWPPASHVHSLFLSFHISSSCQNEMTRPASIAYFQHHQPVGCRDIHTQQLLEKHKVVSYLSGCLTLTLPHYKGDRNDEILFVDVMRKNYTSSYRSAIVNKLIPKSYKNQVKHLTHFSNDLKHKSIEQRMNNVENLLERYKKAKVVFTSLIHCALPCVAMGTPVVFVDAGFNNNAAKRDRFGGILDFFPHVVDVSLPLGKRTLLHRLMRISGLYRLSLTKLKPIDEMLFRLTPNQFIPQINAKRMKESIQHFFSNT